MRIAVFLLASGSVLLAQTMNRFEMHLASGKAAMQQSRYAEADRQFREAIADAAALDPNDPASAGGMPKRWNRCAIWTC